MGAISAISEDSWDVLSDFASARGGFIAVGDGVVYLRNCPSDTRLNYYVFHKQKRGFIHATKYMVYVLVWLLAIFLVENVFGMTKLLFSICFYFILLGTDSYKIDKYID